MHIDRPIFILGNIRSGTTILYNIMATHPDVCWISNYSDRYANLKAIPVVHRVLDIPVIGDRLRARIIRGRTAAPVPRPHEGDGIYHDYAGFGGRADGIEQTLTPAMERRLREKIEAHIRFTGKRRFLSKQTANNRRVELLGKMFPDAFYVHSIRDGRAVASSTLRVPWWKETNIWWLGYTASQWAEAGRPPIELSARYWMRTVQEVRRHRESLGDRYLEIRYEDLVRDTRGVVGRIAEACSLRPSRAFMNRVPPVLPDMNYKWREQLSREEKTIVTDAVGEFLEELGYTAEAV